jgi:endonuclease/exonuclease/phosphatase family metal-dependent hydrolase
MPFYNSIRGKTQEGKQTVEGLLRLKEGLEEIGLPKRTVSDRLLLATWNIRELGPSKFGTRPNEPLHYIAEIIDRFDLVAVQEVRDDLEVFNRLRGMLGGWWKVLLTDVTEGAPGNRERMAFLYDSRKLNFGGLAGEIVLPTRKNEEDPLAADQIARTPYLVGFQTGWFKFTICTAHIYYGESVPDDPRRTREIRELARFLASRAKEKHAWAKNMILLGDFNIFAPEDVTMQAITDAGFAVPEQLTKIPSNVPQNKHYDQIAFIAPDLEDRLSLCDAGVLNFFKYVYRPEDEELYRPAMGDAYLNKKNGTARTERERTTYYNQWRTFQMSDHLPMWIELQTDFSEAYLRKKIGA